MAAYTLDVISHHQRNILFLLYVCDLEDSIKYFLLHSHIQTLVCIDYK